MREIRKFDGIVGIIILFSLVITGCRSSAAPFAPASATPTPTDLPGVLLTAEENTHPCAGLSGGLEVQILVGPSEVVGMAPVAVGQIPFSVAERNGTYIIEGGGSLVFDEQVFEAEWGTYTVNFSADTTVSGECKSLDVGEDLFMIVTMDGEQMVSVRSEGLTADYPWSGTQEIQVSFPGEEGATESGEGWTLVLHLTP
ncbi:MAG: hypothetical protein SCH68_09945 [Brevefilum sp.]|nr:hypothetical protein [Brevefilum sp.]